MGHAVHRLLLYSHWVGSYGVHFVHCTSVHCVESVVLCCWRPACQSPALILDCVKKRPEPALAQERLTRQRVGGGGGEVDPTPVRETENMERRNRQDTAVNDWEKLHKTNEVDSIVLLYVVLVLGKILVLSNFQRNRF